MLNRILLSILSGVVLILVSCNPAPTIEKDGGIRIVAKTSYRSFFKSVVRDGNSQSLDTVLDAIDNEEAESIEMYLKSFIKAEQIIATDLNIVSLFTIPEFGDRLNYNSTEEDVINVLKKEWENGCKNMVEIVKSRVSHLGYPNATVVQTADNEFTIEIPGVSSADNMIDAIFARGELGFWETYENQECFTYLNDVNEYLKNHMDILKESFDSLPVDSVIAQTPLFWLLSPAVDNNNQLLRGSVVGFVLPENRTGIERLLSHDSISIFLPRNCKFLWSKEMGQMGNPYYELVALRATRTGGAALEGDVVTDADVDINNNILLQMNNEGANIWQRLTADNIGLNIAITVDNVVYSHPTVNGEIEGGKSSIAGNFTKEEAQDLAVVVNSGMYPLPLIMESSEIIHPK